MEVITEVTRPTLHIDNVIIETTGTGSTLKSTAKRYTPLGSDGLLSKDKPGYVLIFAHGTGFHKEQWETTIQRLFEHTSGSPTQILEAWAVDAQTHGSSAELNTPTIDDPSFTYRALDYGEACANLYKTFIAGRVHHGIHKVVLLGHSAGAASVTLATSFLDPAAFDSLILVEPAIWPEDMLGKDTPIYKVAVRSIPYRHAKWPTRVEARRFFESRAPWSRWDNRILDVYVKHGLKALPQGGVSLMCSPKHEAAPFILDHNAVAPIPVLNDICQRIPVHVVFGEINDMFSRAKQESLLRDRFFTSVTRVPDAGHMIVQEAPDDLADVLFGILQHDRESKL
ncbi:alpha/beta-hydrolase [Hymenopellis radicata]|nr:alpha/beta-hydrolase [Hymenopellis radicata]